MLRVGLTGGLASGKSFVGKTLAELGCYWIQADELAHRLMQPGGEVFDAVVREFGSGILKKDGTIDRHLLASQVFHDPDRLAVLNGLVHPAVIRLEDALIEKYFAAHPDGIAVVEAAILVEAGSHHRYDHLIVVHCTQEQQMERALRREGASREEVEARLSRQLPIEEKRKLADYVIDTSGSKEETAVRVREVYEMLRRPTV